MSRWFRMYADVLDDPKVQKLPPDLFKVWVNLLCLAARNDGMLPPMEDIAFALRLSQDVTVTVTADLVQRGLLDECDGLSPHNWAERQFKSDTPESAAERKRKQRAREKQAQNPDNVTECHSDSHAEVTPPEQSRTEQSRTHTEGACDKDPKHWEEVQDIIKDRLGDVSDWEIDFLHSIKWTPTLSSAQAEKLRVIRQRLATKDAPLRVLPTVTRGTPPYDAWIAYYRRQSKTGKTFHETKDCFTVPSEYPPQEKAA
jgi:hypothetical protein